jgi:UDP-3-O-[3-hydroxymyristoyl] glucosamine N-acyltransferase
MKLSREYKLSEIAEIIGARIVGAPDFPVTGLNEIHKVVSGDIVFVDHPKYYDKALESAATVVLINKEVEAPEGKALLISDQPFDDFNTLTRHFSPHVAFSDQGNHPPRVHPSAIVHPSAVLGDRVSVGERTEIGPGVVIHSDCTIGNDVIIHPNTVIGADAFYYKKRDNVYTKMHTCGYVVIEDDVEIGALCTIDKGVTGETRIGKGSKLDNQVHVGHDTVIGRNCLFAAQVGIAGCVIIEDNVTLWGQVGIPSDRRIGKGSVALGQSGIMNDMEPGKTYFGSPADEARVKWTEFAAMRKLPELLRKLK